MACPYFIPSEPHKRELWTHRDRLPLGDGFAGSCGVTATGCNDETLRLHCNLGYAECAHLPAERAFDAVRFQLTGEGSATIRLQFACEREHRPALCGELRYDRVAESWIDPPDPRLVALADATVRAWIARRLAH